MKNKLASFFAVLMCCVFFQTTVWAGDSTAVVEKLTKVASDSIVSIKYTLNVTRGQQSQEQEQACLGTMVDSSGIVFVANSIANPTAPPGMSVRSGSFRVLIGEKTYNAKLIYKDAEKDYAFLRLGSEEDSDEDAETPKYNFQSASFSPRKLKMGDELYSLGRYGETYEYGLWYANFNISGVITTPKLMYGVNNAMVGSMRGTPAFDREGNAVGLLLAATMTTATGQVRPTGAMFVKPVDGFAEVIKNLPAPGEEEEFNPEEEGFEEDEDFDLDDEDLDLENEGSGE